MSKDSYHTRNLFLQCMCGIYMAAFCSLYLQIPGLYGENGILPAHTQLGKVQSPTDCFKEKKTLMCFGSSLGLNTSYMMELIALVGTFLGFIGLVWKRWCTSFMFAALWILYLSLYKVGQTFLWFQWDSLLLEIGFLTILVAPVTWPQSQVFKPSQGLSMWLIRWALFRLMFASGVVKLQSMCPTWWGLTALDVHFESQCIPTSIAWFAHHLPAWLRRLGVAGTYLVEIPIPFLFFSPVRAHRIFSFYMQVMLQMLIIVTGNYNFFNFLTVVMSFSLIDDVHLGYKKGRDNSYGLFSSVKNFTNWLLKWIGFCVINYYFLAYFSLKFNPRGEVDSAISFTKENFGLFVRRAVPASIIVASVSLLLHVAEAFTVSMVEVGGTLKKVTATIVTLSYTLAVVGMFGISLNTFTVLDPPTRDSLWPNLRELYKQSEPFEVTHSYGLFRQMTGVGGRPEVVLEGANSLKGPWKEYEFQYKPGKLDRAPPFIAPHQPRLDWQLWFAALGSYQQNPWFVSLSYRLLKGDQSVVAFLADDSNWRQKPPKYIKASRYFYTYTHFNETSPTWWARKLDGDYMPTYEVNHGPLLDYLRNMQFIGVTDVRAKNRVVTEGLDAVRGFMTMLPHHVMVWSLYGAAGLIAFTRGKF